MKSWVAALVLANGLVLAWWQGYLSPLVDPPGASEREPLRLARQLRPEAVRVVPQAAASGSRAGAGGGDSGAPAAAAATGRTSEDGRSGSGASGQAPARSPRTGP